MALTPRELQVLRLVAKGKTSQEIAAKLHLSEVTVKWHIGNAMHKLGAASRAEAVAVALRRGLL
jgi:DNA-binding CsgD family transcriptional regulator